MNFPLSILGLVGGCYFFALLLCVWAVKKNIIPKNLVRHPLIYILSLGVYTGSWSYYGSAGVAYDSGYAFLAFYFGVGGAFFLVPILFKPIFKLAQENKLVSLPDLFTFCFKSSGAGVLATILLIITVMPLLALQIQVVSGSVYWLNHLIANEIVVFCFCILVAVVTIFIGTVKIDVDGKNTGLVFFLACENIFKLIVMIVLGFFIIYEVFGGFFEIGKWLKDNNDLIVNMRVPVEEIPWKTYLLMFFASAIVAPHMFHMIFSENKEKNILMLAGWSFPILLLFFSMIVPLILWSGIKINAAISPDYFSLIIGQYLEKNWLVLMIFLVGISGGSGLIIVTVLSLSSMLVTHFGVFRHCFINKRKSVFNADGKVLFLKRIVIILIILCAYLLYISIKSLPSLNRLVIVAYSGMLQLFPAVVWILYGDEKNKVGFILGVISGGVIWFYLLLLPLLLDWVYIPWGEDFVNHYFYDNWYVATGVSLMVNSVVMIGVSKFIGVLKQKKLVI